MEVAVGPANGQGLVLHLTPTRPAGHRPTNTGNLSACALPVCRDKCPCPSRGGLHRHPGAGGSFAHPGRPRPDETAPRRPERKGASRERIRRLPPGEPAAAPRGRTSNSTSRDRVDQAWRSWNETPQGPAAPSTAAGNMRSLKEQNTCQKQVARPDVAPTPCERRGPGRRLNSILNPGAIGGNRTGRTGGMEKSVQTRIW